MKKTNVTIKNYDSTKFYVVIDWTGTFEYNPTNKEVRNYTEVFEFDSVPTKKEVENTLREYTPLIFNDDRWTNIIILRCSVLPPMSNTNIILK
jgi:hypothetical protein